VSPATQDPKLAQGCYIEGIKNGPAYGPGRAHALQACGPRAHARRRAACKIIPSRPATNAVTIATSSSVREWFQDPTPHRDAAHHLHRPARWLALDMKICIFAHGTPSIDKLAC
jgi:hypothetical protein